jgi:isoquinoline 1-oxidoreductase subunit beta
MPGVHEIVTLDTAVVAVADTYWHAQRAVEAVDLTTTGGIDQDETTIRQALAEGVAGPWDPVNGAGADPFAHEGPALDAVYHFPYLAHATMEPMNCTAVVRNGRCEIWAPTQSPSTAQALAADITGLPIEHVVMHTTYLGGGFGRRSRNDFVEQTVRVAMRINRPVKLIWSREEDIGHDFYRPAMVVRVRGNVHRDGIAAIEARLAGPSVLAAYRPDEYGGMTSDQLALEGLNDTPYGFRVLQSSYRRIEPGVPVWFWRSVSNSHNTYALECSLDELARGAGMDGLQIRTRLLASKPIELAVLRRALKRAKAKRSAGTALGIAFVQMRRTTIAVVAEVSLIGATHVRLHRITCAVDCGLVVNPLAAEAQIESGVIWALSAAWWGEIGIANGQAVQRNFDTYQVARITQVPPIDVSFSASGVFPGGLGEVGAGAVAPALANAIRAAGGPSIRSLPFSRSGITLAGVG